MYGMNKCFIAGILGCLCVGHGSTASAQRCRSVQAGDLLAWDNWDCGCDPLYCDALELDHAMILGSDISIATAVVIVNAQGSLASTQRLDISARVENRGMISAPWMWFNGSDHLINTGRIEGDVVLLVKDSIYNGGEVLGHDSLVLGQYRPCYNEGSMSGAFYYGLGALFNVGTIRCDSSWTRNHFNFSTGLTEVTGNWFASGAFLNEGVVQVGSLQVVSGFDNHGSMSCSGSFLNGSAFGGADSRLYEGASLFTGEFVNPLGAYFRGPGTLCVAGRSENHGVITAPITICDVTLVEPEAPYLDVNTGSFQQPIYYCTNPVCASVSVPESAVVRGLRAYPVPAVDALSISVPGATATLMLFDATGRKVREVRGPFTAEVVLERNGEADGVYSAMGFSTEGACLGAARVVFVAR